MQSAIVGQVSEHGHIALFDVGRFVDICGSFRPFHVLGICISASTFEC